MEPISAIATEVSKKALEATEKEAKTFLSCVLGEPAKALGGVLTDQINSWRFRNLISIVVKAKGRLQDAGVSPEQVPLKIIHPLLEGASLEQDPELQQKWANLLANAADPRKKVEVLPIFTTILKGLTNREVQFLNAFYEVAQSRRAGPNGQVPVTAVQFGMNEAHEIFCNTGLSKHPYIRNVSQSYLIEHAKEFDEDYAEGDLICELLQRHGLIEQRLTAEPQPDNSRLVREVRGGETPHVQLIPSYQLTHLGAKFVRACKPEK